MPAQFEQGERGGVGSTSVIYWLSIIAFADILCSQLDKSFRADTDLAGASSQGKRGWLGNTVFAKPAGWGWHHSCRRASGVGAAAHFSQGQRGVIGSTYSARSVGWCWQHSFRRASGAWTTFAGPAGWGRQHSSRRAGRAKRLQHRFRMTSGVVLIGYVGSSPPRTEGDTLQVRPEPFSLGFLIFFKNALPPAAVSDLGATFNGNPQVAGSEHTFVGRGP